MDQVINKILQKLNGSAGSVSKLTAEIESLRGMRADVERRQTELSKKISAAYDEGAPRKVFEELNADLAWCEDELESIARGEHGLRSRLETARDQERKSAEPKFVAEYDSAFRDYAAALRKLAEAHARQVSIRERAAALLGQPRSAVLLPPYVFAGIMTTAAIDEWLARNGAAIELAGARRLETERARAAGALPTQAPAPVVVARAKPTPRPSLQHRVSTAETGTRMTTAEAAALRAKRVSDDTSPLEPGQSRVRVARSGFSPRDDAPQAHHGQVLRMPVGSAQRAAENGAVEIIETYGGAASPPQSAGEHAEAAS